MDFLGHDLMVPPYQIHLPAEDKNRAVEYCKHWVIPTPQKWKIGDVFTIPLMNEAWFKEMCAENQQDELRFMYFETVIVMVPGYYNQV